ncbi:MAG: hypothetical protein LCI00_32730 [Chloroflexi bacterium]|nr:hypothetical protein [Chloroflexota bacterium]
MNTCDPFVLLQDRQCLFARRHPRSDAHEARRGAVIRCEKLAQFVVIIRLGAEQHQHSREQHNWDIGEAKVKVHHDKPQTSFFRA